MPDAVVLDMPTFADAHIAALELEENKNNRGFIVTALTVDIPDASKTRPTSAQRPPPLWRTPEFFFYYLVAAVVIPFMVWVPISLSSRAFIAIHCHARIILTCNHL